eukprot:306706-Chlamydomonas_euryale.AAC.3
MASGGAHNVARLAVSLIALTLPTWLRGAAEPPMALDHTRLASTCSYSSHGYKLQRRSLVGAWVQGGWSCTPSLPNSFPGNICAHILAAVGAPRHGCSKPTSFHWKTMWSKKCAHFFLVHTCTRSGRYSTQPQSAQPESGCGRSTAASGRGKALLSL